MSRPLLVAVEDDAERLPLLERELRNRYSVDYEVRSARVFSRMAASRLCRGR